MAKSNLIEMHNVGIVVQSLDNAILFFSEIGLSLEKRSTVEGEWAGRLTGFVTFAAPREYSSALQSSLVKHILQYPSVIP